MTTAQWTRIANDGFILALFGYLTAMVGYFHYVAFSREAVWRAASTVTWISVAAQAISIVARGLAAGRPPWGNMYEYSSLISMLVVLGYLIFVERRYKARTLGGFALAFSVVTMSVAGLFLYVGPGPLVPALNSYWRDIHVTSIMLASALLALGSGVLTPLFLYQERRERRWKRDEARMSDLASRDPKPIMGGSLDVDQAPPPHLVLGADAPTGSVVRRGLLPSAAKIDQLAYRMIAFGFPLWTFATIAGAIWGQESWGRYWGWDPKETWAFITWVIFAGYLHARATSGWRGRKAAVIALVGFASLLVTYYAVNLWIAGLHSYAGV